MSPDLLAILRCPRTGEVLQYVPEATVQKLNDKIAAAELRDANGEPVIDPIEGGLMNAGGQWCYPIRDQIPSLIPGEAIPLSTISHH
jgi:uncharacterized protein YbaR (Trm112 family)